MITLDNQRNVYIRDGFEYARVTTILQAVGIIDPQWYTKDGATRGTYVHQACALFDQDRLDWSSIDPRIEGYVNAWAKFRKDSKDRFYNLFIEKMLWSDKSRIAGTADRIDQCEGNQIAILDIKTGDSDFAGIQTAGYQSMFDCLNDEIYLIKRTYRYAVQLNEYGLYKLKPLTDISDRTIWQSAVNVYRFKNKIRSA